MLIMSGTKKDIMMADGATLKLDYQKNGWKYICMFQEHNSKWVNCPVRALGWQYCHIREHNGVPCMLLLACFMDSGWSDMMVEDMSWALKVAATALEYPVTKWIPIEWINMHSPCSGGVNELALAGYSDTQIQKMERW